MEIENRREGDVEIIVLEGEMDGEHAIPLRNLVDNLVKDGTDKILLDCSDLTYMNSAGMRELIAIYKLIIQNNGSLKFVNLQDDIKELFNFTNLSNIFSIYDNLEQALGDF